VIPERRPIQTRSERMDALACLPIFLSLKGRRAVLAGNHSATSWKAELLSAAGAIVDIYAREPAEDLLEMVAGLPRETIAMHRREWTAADFAGAAIAVGGFTDDTIAAAFAAAARDAGVLVNVIDKPALSDVSFGSIVNRSPLVIGISTDGAAPILAQAIRAKLETLLPKGLARWTEAAARWRAALKESGLPFAGRRRFWRLFTSHALSHVNGSPDDSIYSRLLRQVRSSQATVKTGSVTLVGAGPGDPELLTLRAVRELQAADVILFDDLVSHDVLDFARREAKKMLVGKTGHGPSCKQDDINAMMVSLALQGKRVVRLKGGDPLIFARASEEIAACRSAGIVVDVVPGITAAQGAASRLGLPLTGREQVRRLQYVTGHAQGGRIPDDIDWKSLADPSTTTAIYMPTKTLATLIEQAIERGLDPQTPAVAISRATQADESVIAAPICELPPRVAAEQLAGPLLVMLGRALAMQSTASRSDDEARRITI